MDIIGHRGARGEAPENTLSGFRYLKSLGITRVEFDIQVAGDGQLAVIHDDTLDRTTSDTGSIKHHTIADLAAINACNRLFPDWPEAGGVPSLKSVLGLLAGFDHLQLEVKAKSMEDCQIVAARLPALWKPLGVNAVTTSFNLDYLRLIQKQHPQIPRGLLVDRYFVGNIVSMALELGCVMIAPHHSLLTRPLVEQAHKAGLKVSTWTVNEPERMIELRDMGIDSLITDYPSRALEVLQQ